MKARSRLIGELCRVSCVVCHESDARRKTQDARLKTQDSRLKTQDSRLKGTVLITVIIILVFLAVLGMSLIAFLFSRTAYSQMQLDRLRALYLAESGISKALWELRFDVDPDGDGQGNIPKKKLGDGFFWARHNFQTSTLTGTGEVNKARRVVQIKYSAI